MPHDEKRLTGDAQEVWDHKVPSNLGSEEGSHWRGHGDWDEATWLGYGSAHREMVEDGLRMLGRSAKIRRVVEWGSGGGANMFAISPVAEKYFGVDISASNLAECERQAESVDLKNVEPVHVPVDRPEAVLDQILEGRDAKIDCFLSTAVYQHLPGRKYARRVTSVAHQLLADDGLAVINIRYWDLARQNRNWRRSYKDNAHTFNKYTMFEFQREMDAAGFEILEIRMQPETHHVFFYLRKRLG